MEKVRRCLFLGGGISGRGLTSWFTGESGRSGRSSTGIISTGIGELVLLSSYLWSSEIEMNKNGSAVRVYR